MRPPAVGWKTSVCDPEKSAHEAIMNVLIYLVPMALALGLTALFAFFWSIRNRQYDDMDGAALRVLSDDDVEPSNGFPGRGPGA